MTNGNSAAPSEFELALNEFASLQRAIGQIGEMGYTKLSMDRSNELHAKLLEMYRALSVCADGGKGDEHDSRMWDAGYSAGIDFERRRNALLADGGKGEAVASVCQCGPTCQDSGEVCRYTAPQAQKPVGEFVGYQKVGFQQFPIIVWNCHVPMGTMLYTAPQAECAPREAQPVVEAMQAYLLQCRVGGMPKDVSDQIERAVNQANHLGYFAAPTPERADEMKLDKPAQVSGTRFSKGVKWATVIGAAQRYYEFIRTPEKEAMRIENARAFIESIHAKSLVAKKEGA